MTNNTINELLNSFNNNELKKFSEFIISPYFNKNDNVVRLFKFLAGVKVSQRGLLTFEEIHKQIYGNEKFSKENVKTLIYLLTRLIEKFLAINSLENDTTAYNNRLLRTLHKKDLDKHFIRLHKQFEAFTNDGALQIEDLYTMMDTEKLLTEFYAKKTDEVKIYEHFLKVSEHLIAGFLVDMLKQYILFWRFSYLDNNYNEDYTTAFLDTIETHKVYAMLKEKKFPYLEFITPYYEIFCFLNNSGEFISISSLRENISSNSFITDHEKFILSTSLVNTLYYKVLREGTKHSKELFESFKLLLSLYEYSGEKYLRFTIYTNIIRLSVQLGEYDWAEKFINESVEMIDPASRENMFYYGKCYLAFGRGDFEKCLEYESKINYSTFQQQYYMRDLRLCSLYELEKYESALSLIDSYKHFIRTDKSYKPKMKQTYMLFLQFMHDLIRLKLGISRKEISSVKNKLTESLPMRKDWLLKKYTELA